MIKSYARNAVQIDLPHIGHINVNPHYSMGRTASTCLHTGSPDCSGQPTTQPTNHVITLEGKRKLIC